MTTGLSSSDVPSGAPVVRQVGNDEQFLTQRFGDLVVVGVELLLALAERPALGLERLGFVDVAVAPQHADVFRDRLHAGAQLVALGDDLADPDVELGGPVERCQHGLVTPTCERGADVVEIGADESYVDHVGPG